jgi:hypothetical protein
MKAARRQSTADDLPGGSTVSAHEVPCTRDLFAGRAARKLHGDAISWKVRAPLENQPPDEGAVPELQP